MKFELNNLGQLFLKKRKRTINEYIYLAPIITGLSVFLFLFSARNQGQYYFGIILSVFLIIFNLLGLFKNLRSLNRYVKLVSKLEEGVFRIETFRSLFHKSKTVLFNIDIVKLRNEEVNFSKLEKEEVCRIQFKNGKKFYIAWSHFSPELKELLFNKN